MTRQRTGLNDLLGIADVLIDDCIFGHVDGRTLGRIDDRIVAGQAQLRLGLYDTKKEGADGVYTLSSKVSGQVEGLEDEAEDEAGYQLRSAVF